MINTTKLSKSPPVFCLPNAVELCTETLTALWCVKRMARLRNLVHVACLSATRKQLDSQLSWGEVFWAWHVDESNVQHKETHSIETRHVECSVHGQWKSLSFFDILLQRFIIVEGALWWKTSTSDCAWLKLWHSNICSTISTWLNHLHNMECHRKIAVCHSAPRWSFQFITVLSRT